MVDREVAVDVFQDSKDDSASQTNQQNPQTEQPGAQTPSAQNNTKANPSTEQGTTQPTQDNTLMDNSAQQSNMSFVPWVGAGIVAIVILIALFVIIQKLNKKKA